MAKDVACPSLRPFLGHNSLWRYYERTQPILLMLRAILREYLGSEELSNRSIALTPGLTPITIGRSESSTYQVGNEFGELVRWVARIQVTIVDENGAIKLFDGVKGKPSTNGVYSHTERIATSILLTPGLQLTLFKAGRAKITLDVTGAVTGGGRDTFNGDDLLDRLQEKVEALDGQIGALHEQVNTLHRQVELFDRHLEQSKAIDINQEGRLILTEKRLNRVLAVTLGCFAVIVLASGWTGGSAEDKKQWSSTLTSIAIGAAALYFKSKENQVEKPKPS